MVFIDLRDRYGFTQFRFGDETPRDVFERAKNVGRESCVVVRGTVAHRGEGNVSQKFKTGELPTGEVEVRVTEFEVLSESPPPPFEISDYSTANEELRLESRWLDLRRPALQKNFIVRHRVAKTLRDYFDANGFLELETPFLTKSTPEGARDFLVPSRTQPGNFFALPQSPQLFKQLFMMSGFDRYVQIVRCFRDEDLRADRQPEFTQLDLEMSFVQTEDVIDMAEGAIAAVFKAVMNHEFPRPLPHMTYHEAMDRYGIDRPDTRFGLELQDVSDIAAKTEFAVFRDALAKGGVVKCIVSSDPTGKVLTRKVIDGLTEEIKGMGGARAARGEGRRRRRRREVGDGHRQVPRAGHGRTAGEDRREGRRRDLVHARLDRERLEVPRLPPRPARHDPRPHSAKGSGTCSGSPTSRCSSGTRRRSGGTRSTTPSPRRRTRTCPSCSPTTRPGSGRSARRPTTWCSTAPNSAAARSGFTTRRCRAASSSCSASARRRRR